MVEAPWSRSTTWMMEKVLGDPEVVALVKERYVPVRVARDRRPDIDLRYQIAVSIITRGDSGWPLLVMLTPEGEALYGSSYITLEDRKGARGLRSLLKGTSDIYKRTPQSTVGPRKLVFHFFDREKEVTRRREVTPHFLEEVSDALSAAHDPESGGFGGTPRVPNPFVLELAGTLYHRTGNTRYLDMLMTTLHGMERGAIYDRLGGGIHRATSDPTWRYPEFEKLLTYNATFLLNVLMAVEISGDPDLKAAAERTLGYILSTLTDPAGGFYASQHAASSADEPKGSLYAWTEEEFRKTIPAAQDRLARLLFNFTAEGEFVLGPPPRGLLYLAIGRKEAAAQINMTDTEARLGEAAILDALTAARAGRAAPPVDRSIYVDSSAWGVVAMMEAARVLGSEPARRAGLAAVDRMMAMIPAAGPLRHRVHPAPDVAYDPPLALDHVMLAYATTAVYEATLDKRYLDAAADLMQRAHALFWDAQEGGFYDVVADPNAPGYLKVRRRLPNDTAFPSLNSLAVRVMNRLAFHTGEASWRSRSEQCLHLAISTLKKVEYFQAGLALAAESYLREPTRYVIVGRRDDARAEELVAAARRLFNPGKVVQWLNPGTDNEAIEKLHLKKGRSPFVVACEQGRCTEPSNDVASLARRKPAT